MVASPWSPPPYMKTKQKFNGDGHLKSEWAASWAMHYVKFIKAMKDVGVDIWCVTVQNEAEAAQKWESCIYTAEEEKAFVRDHLGPALHDNSLGFVKIMIWDHNRDGMLERAAAVYSDPVAAKYVWGCAYHWYGDARFETWPDRYEVKFADRKNRCFPLELRGRTGLDNVRRVSDLCPEKHILFTEGCQEIGKGRTLEDVLGDWKIAERYSSNIISDLNSGTEGWIDWNLWLDEKGGPNHVNNMCLAPIICDTNSDSVMIQPAYWHVAHFSKYIKPGAKKLICSTSRDVLELVAFKNLDESVIVVVLNQSRDDLAFWLKIDGLAASIVSPGRSITTFIIDDEEEGTTPGFRDAVISRTYLMTAYGKFLRAHPGLCQIDTSPAGAGWEEFVQFAPKNEPYCYFRTFHGTWLSVADDGRLVTTNNQLGPSEQFILEPQRLTEEQESKRTEAQKRYTIIAFKNVAHDSYISVEQGDDVPVVTSTVAGRSERFAVSNLNNGSVSGEGN